MQQVHQFIRIAAVEGGAERQVDAEPGAFAGFAAHLDAPAHHLHQFAADRQPQAAAAVAAGGAGIGLGKGLEQGRLRLGGNPDAAVADAVEQALAPSLVEAPLHAQGDMAFGGELEGVAEQVRQDLAQTRRVAVEAARHAPVQAQMQAQAFLPGLGAEQGEGVGE